MKLHKFLLENKKEYVLSKQVLRSGTAIGALVREAQNAESKADFIHKLGVAQKENDETLYWLELLFETEYLGEKKIYQHAKGFNRTFKNDTKCNNHFKK